MKLRSRPALLAIYMSTSAVVAAAMAPLFGNDPVTMGAEGLVSGLIIYLVYWAWSRP